MRRTSCPCRPAFTIVELLVVVAIIGVLIGILLPAVSNARNQAKLTASQSNLRQLGVAHANYASNWSGRQFTLAVDNMSSYGDNPREAVANYILAHRVILPDGNVKDIGWPPPIELGWGENGNEPFLWMLHIEPGSGRRHYSLLEPIAFGSAWGPRIDIPRFGYFRFPNARQFSQYLGGRFFDGVFYAPRDEAAMDLREGPAESPYEYPNVELMKANYDWGDNDFCYSSYSLSPAALFTPEVMGHKDGDEGGWKDPWSLPAGLRAPSLAQARYPSLKTHMLEHHWLQKPPQPCNPAVVEPDLRPYRNCQPFFFNQGWDSSPATLFYDGHVAQIGIRESQRADGQVRTQTGSADWGLWSRDTPFGADGYWIGRGYDVANSSVHILTTDGILGRDITTGG